MSALLQEIGARVAVGLTIFGAVYLIAAFVYAGFNIALWPESGRAFTGFMGGVLALAVTTFPFASFRRW